MSYDGRRIILPGETESESTVSGVWGRYGVGVSGSPPTDAEWEGNERGT